MIKVVRPGEIIPAKVSALDHVLSIDDLAAGVVASLSSPTMSYRFDLDPNDSTQIFVEHPLPYPDRLAIAKATAKTYDYDIKRLQYYVEQLHHDNQALHLKLHQHDVERQQRDVERQRALTIQCNWETRSRVAQALNDIHVQRNIDKEEYRTLKLRGYNYLPVALSSWAVFNRLEPAARLAEMGEISDEEFGSYYRKGRAIHADDLEESMKFVWDSIPHLERDVMILMFLTRPYDRTGIAHPHPTVDQGRQLIQLDRRITQAEKDFIRDFIPTAEDKSKNRLFS